MSSGGYTLVPGATTFAPGTAAPFTFRVVGPGKTPVTKFAVVHDKPLHLILVRRDLSGYQHLHPTMAPDGTWSVSLTLPSPGSWRAIADFTVTGTGGSDVAATLGVDLTAPGAYAPAPLPPAARTATVEGFTVTHEGALDAAPTSLQFRVARDGAPVTNLERYLGSYGHLVVVREGDLAYLHVHPENAAIGGAVRFSLTLPQPGRYRAYFDFQVGGQVRTAEFTVQVP